MALLPHLTGWSVTDPGLATEDDCYRVHSRDYVRAVHDLSAGMDFPSEEQFAFGFMEPDNPTFAGMYEAALAYSAGSVAAARAVLDGERLAITLAGGLHHALSNKASGFCIFNDCAIACHVLRERFGRVAYVDIDLHHGDGVQWIFYSDPHVLTCSIHEDPRTLWPRTGRVDELGPAGTSINVPLEAGTSPDVWLWAFEHGILEALRAYRPQAIVLQMGTDSHRTDPLGHLANDVRHWLEAIAMVRDLGVPVVALGGGGYDLDNVSRMWTAAALVLAERPVPDETPEPFATEWGVRHFMDSETFTHYQGELAAEQAVDWLQQHAFRRLAELANSA